MEQLLAHLVGDYFLQPHVMSQRKTSQWLWAILHGLCYTLPFIVITRNIYALLIISVTHMVIDRYRLAKLIAKIKNWHWSGDGYPDDTPDWLRVWLMIITDNTMHIFINYVTLLHFK